MAYIITVDGEWYPWESWSGCDRSCNKGLRTRARKCQFGLHGGKNCTGASNEEESCNDFPCPGIWGISKENIVENTKVMSAFILND